MIAYLPEIYPDELVYSWFCRYFVHSGFLTHKAALRSLYCKKSDNPSKEFLGRLNSEALSVIKAIMPIETLVLDHTMFPQYARFIPRQQKKMSLDCICSDFRDIHHLFSVLPRSECDIFLKYCPMCASEDRNNFGETYWHRSHQIRGITVCPEHCCMLEISSVEVKSELSYVFCPAEEYVGNHVPKFTNNAELIKYSRYINDVFDAKLELKTDVPIRAVLYHSMKDTKYMKHSGKMRNTHLICNDMSDFYRKIGVNNIASFNQIQRVLLADGFEFSVICQIAYFLGLSVKELNEAQITEEIIRLEQSTHYMKDKPKIDWDEYDSKLLPVLERVAKDIYYGSTNKDGRPERVSERSIYREMGLPNHRLEVLPRCREVFNKYSETYEENWARRIVWAYNKLQDGGQPIHWSNIRKLTGVKKINIDKTIPFIKRYADNVMVNGILTVLCQAERI